MRLATRLEQNGVRAADTNQLPRSTRPWIRHRSRKHRRQLLIPLLARHVLGWRHALGDRRSWRIRRRCQYRLKASSDLRPGHVRRPAQLHLDCEDNLGAGGNRGASLDTDQIPRLVIELASEKITHFVNELVEHDRAVLKPLELDEQLLHRRAPACKRGRLRSITASAA